MSASNLLIAATFTGFFGDALLQLLVAAGAGGPTGWGLDAYFKHQGRAEAMFTAAGMLAIFFSIYILAGFPRTWVYLALFGVVLDLIFRWGNIFPSLEGYYNALNYFWSAVWGIIPMVLPLLIVYMLGGGA